MHPILVNVHHDLFDYFAAFGGLIGGIAALVALIFAALSKRDAARSAAAAERSATAAEGTKALADQQVEIMRREAGAAFAERQRRAAPTIEIGAHTIGTSATDPPAMIILTVGFSNDAGDQAHRSAASEPQSPRQRSAVHNDGSTRERLARGRSKSNAKRQAW
jgi:hypothetical protein